MADDILATPPRWVAAAACIIPWLPAGRYRAMNWVGRRRAGSFWMRLPQDLGALEYRCYLRDPLMREACLTGRYEPQETALLLRLLGRGATMVDVGANWGYFTLVGAHSVGSGGRVLAVEADPRACRTIAANLARNRLANVALVPCAASDGEGELVFGDYQPDAGDSGNFGFAETSTVRIDSARHRVRARALDDVLDEAGIAHVDLLKMDIEGGESRALLGLGRHLAAGAIDRILLEVHPYHLRDMGSSAEMVVLHLVACGFTASVIDHSPAAHRRAASGRVDPLDLLTPLEQTQGLGDWPHLLFTRIGVEA